MGMAKFYTTKNLIYEAAFHSEIFLIDSEIKQELSQNFRVIIKNIE